MALCSDIPFQTLSDFTLCYFSGLCVSRFRGCSRDNEGEGMKVVKGPFVVSTSALPAGSIGGNMSGKMKDQIWQEVCHLPKRPTLYLEMSRYLVNDSFSLHPRQ